MVSLTNVGTPNVGGAGVALSNGDGTFQKAIPIQLPVAPANFFGYNSFAVGDMNGVVFGFGVASIAGCGGGSSSQQTPPNPGSPTGSSTVTVTATSMSGGAAITHTLPLTVVIQ